MKLEVGSQKSEFFSLSYKNASSLCTNAGARGGVLACMLWGCVFFILASYNLSAQDVKRSKKIETIEGKKYYIHSVDKGQTLYAIAHAYELKVNDIVIENPDAIDGISPGQTLKIPIPKEKIKTETISKADSIKYYFHKVQQGETLYSLSKFYSMSIDKLKELNPELSAGLKVGQTIKIPAEKVRRSIRDKDGKSVGVQSPAKTSGKQKQGELTKLDPNLQQPTPFISKPILKADTSKKINNFNIALFLPFHLNETLDIDIDKIAQGDADLPTTSEIAIQFYQGAQMALDSLKKSGLIAKLHVYDVNEDDSVQLPEILKKPELLTMDLMVGPLYSSNFIPFSKFAKENQISITSPVSQLNKILFNNPFVSKVTASATTQVEQMADYVVQKYKEHAIIVVNSGNPKDASLVKIFMNRVNAEMREAGTDSVSEVKGFGGIGNFIQPSKTNVIIVPSNNRSFVTDFITKLNPLREKNPIVVFGMQSWSEFDNLDIDYLNNMQTHYPSSTFIDYDSEPVKLFVKKYATQYKTDPGFYVFQGFDVIYFYISMLRSYGLGFQNKLATTKQTGFQTAFEFYQVSPESGFENRAVYMLRYKDYKLVKAN
ncbi:MAG: LysM peptidoglycan-binding domain-containing protein [Bacteroidetes bacterium]|nr:LysM peptidoglycan-binding domain-containing protein [Bacteroidota bacterium]